MVDLTMKELNRYKVIMEVIEGYLEVKGASEILGLSERQIYRIKGKVAREGIKGVIHGSKGKRVPRFLTEEVKNRLNYLYETKYEGFNVTHMSEFLEKEERIKVSRESLRQILLKYGSYSKWKKHPKHRQWREPYPREGQMIQFDTSDHDWLEGRGPKLYLIGGVDDATSKIAGARFAYQDEVKENMKVFKSIVESKGIPLSVYVDGDSKFKTTRYEGIHYHLKGEYLPTQFARALEELGIEIIHAYSPQAKGRIERAFQTFQDRLCSELRLYKIYDLEGANQYLQEKFIPQYNQKFCRPAKEKGLAYRVLSKGVNLKNIFCLKEERTIRFDHTVSYDAKYYQILPDEYRISYAKAKVMVYEHLDGSIHIFYKDKELRSKPIVKERRIKELATLSY